MSDRESCNSFAVGFILGAVAGLAVGFLYAPKPGQETRELIKEKAEEAKEKVSEVAEKAKEAAAEAREKAKEAAAEAREKVQERLGRKKPTE